MRKNHTLDTLTVRVVARSEATIFHCTSLRGEQSSATAVAEVQMKRNPGKIGIVKKQARTTATMADHGNLKCYVPGCAGNVMCRVGLVSVFRKAWKANNAF